MKLHRRYREHFYLNYWTNETAPGLRRAKRCAWECGAEKFFRGENWTPTYHAPHLQEIEQDGYEAAKRWTGRTRNGPVVFCACCRRPYQKFIQREERERRACRMQLLEPWERIDENSVLPDSPQ